MTTTVIGYLDVAGAFVPVAAATPLPMGGTVVVTPQGPATYADGSGTITAGGTSQVVFAANASRRYLLIQNNSDQDMWVNFGIAAVVSQPSVKVAANGGFFEPLVVPASSVTIIGATTGKAFTAKQG